jgi:hypothetical protein
VLADGTDSVVDFSALTTFDPAEVTFTEQNDGIILLP